MFKFFCSLALLLACMKAGAAEFVVWNVGQGLWVTEVHAHSCFHFDMGGENNPRDQVLRLCSGKKNLIHLSHWDWDHVSFVRSYASRLRSVCLFALPQKPPSESKRRLIQNIPLCKEDDLRDLESQAKILFRPGHQASGNEASEVIYSKLFAAIIPGDSPRQQERIWAQGLPSLVVKGLILGHHGSRTSTSKALLERMPGLKWAVASARKLRYGHPHREVVEALKKEKVPLLKTEDWGHLHFLKNERVRSY